MNPLIDYRFYQQAVHQDWLNTELKAWKTTEEDHNQPLEKSPKPISWVVRAGLHLLVLLTAISLSTFLQLLPLLGSSTFLSLILAIASALLAWNGVLNKKWRLKGGIDEGLLTASWLFFGQGLVQIFGFQNLDSQTNWLFILIGLTSWSYLTAISFHASVLALSWGAWFWWKFPEFMIAIPVLLLFYLTIQIGLYHLNRWPHPGKSHWLAGWQQATAMVGPFIPLIGLLVHPDFAMLWPIILVNPLVWIAFAWQQRSLERIVYALFSLIAGLSWLNNHFDWMEWDLWSMLLSGMAFFALLALLFRLKQKPWFWLSDKQEHHPELTMAWNLWLASQQPQTETTPTIEQGGATGGGGASADY